MRSCLFARRIHHLVYSSYKKYSTDIFQFNYNHFAPFFERSFPYKIFNTWAMQTRHFLAVYDQVFVQAQSINLCLYHPGNIAQTFGSLIKMTLHLCSYDLSFTKFPKFEDYKLDILGQLQMQKSSRFSCNPTTLCIGHLFNITQIFVSVLHTRPVGWVKIRPQCCQ